MSDRERTIIYVANIIAGDFIAMGSWVYCDVVASSASPVHGSWIHHCVIIISSFIEVEQ
jgi:hypothetical protein